MPKCLFCDAPAAYFDGVVVSPPVCPVHLDLVILVEWLESRHKPVTVATVQKTLAQAMANAGEWTLVADQIPALLPALLEQKEGQRTAEHAGQLTPELQKVNQ